MNCPNCGAPYNGTGMFCMRCGARLTPQTATPAPAAYQPAPARPAVVPPAPISAPSQAVSMRQPDSVATIRHISAGSVFKVTFVTYLLVFGLIGLFVIVLPGLLGASLLSGLVDDRYGLGALGGGIVGTLLFYVLLVVVGAFVQGLVTAIAALIYNLVAGLVGGVRVELQE